MRGIKLKIEIPGTAIEDVVALLGERTEVVQRADCIECHLPWVDAAGEVVVRKEALPLQADGNAIYVRELADIGKMASLRSDGGIVRLLSAAGTAGAIAALDNRLRRIKELMQADRKVYIFAAHRNAVKCIQYCQSLGLDIVAFIDNDAKKQGQEFYGKEVLPLEHVAKDAVIINASGRYCVPIEEQMNALGYSNNINLMEFLFIYNLPFQAQGAFRDFISEVIPHRLKIVSLYLMLADEQSREVLDSLVSYRMTLNSVSAGRVASPYDEEFFARDVLKFGAHEVFVDGGAYDGDSFNRFVGMAAEFARAYLFEPDTEIFEKLGQVVADDKRVIACNAGLFSKSGEIGFSSTGGMDGAISETGEERISVVALDDMVDVAITHIKLDVEGAEEAALLGARGHLREDRPKMAVAAYHKAGDLWEVPALIEGLGGKYNFYLRHYSQTMDDSIFYALPAE